MELTRKERLILANQFKILEHLDKKEADFYRNAYKVLEKGYAFEYDGLFQWLGDGMSNAECTEVIDILEMHSRVNYALRTVADKSGIDEVRLRFKGFDGNNEGAQMSYAEYLIKDQGKWEEFREMDLNSHFPTLDHYRRMLARWKATDLASLELTNEQIRQIIDV
jgi:uncharacterized protein YfbU (UPF0304 family)